ncbi:MAG: type II toxin-antitoxin system HicB family antitoxin [Fimbriimonadaceae bacterium]|nr:type II toxin-antitoxin system HicB family antitoxin [Fimbriimonadaceae bacterium]
MSRYLIVIEREGQSWGAYAPDLPGLGVVASTREEVEKLAVEAVAQHAALLRELGQPVPLPQAEIAYFGVA